MKLLEGAGGGGQKSPVRTEDNLLSDDFMELIMGVSEGPIKGLVGTLPIEKSRSIMVGETPLVNSTGVTNFAEFVWAMYNGTPQDTPIDLTLGGISSSTAVGVTLLTATPVVRQTSPAQRGSMNRIDVRLRIQQLLRQNDDGVFNHTAEFSVEYKPSLTGTWKNWDPAVAGTTTSLTGKTTGGYVREFSIVVPVLTNDDYDIRVTKISPTSTTTDVVEIEWESFQMTTTGSHSFPNLAVLHVKGKATNQFTSVPTFSGIYDGWVMSVPTNYNPVLRTYDEAGGPWLGIFQQAWTNNPAWALYNLITDTRLGLAQYYKNVAANRYVFYQAAKWCDTPVPDGAGGYQPRFSFNEWISQERSGMELLQYIAGSFNATLVDDENGTVHLRSDDYVTPLQIFTPDNVSAEGFQYSYSDISTRVNSMTVSFVNPDLDWNEDRRVYEDAAAIAENGRIPQDFIAVGCTNVHEAIRRAAYRVKTANTEVTSVSFVTSRLGMLTAVFDSIYVADPTSGWSASGRVKSIVGDLVNLRDPIFFTSTLPVTMSIQTAEGLTDVTVTPPGAGLQSSFTRTAGAFPTGMPPQVVFTLQGSTFGLPKPFKVMSIEEKDEGGRSFHITALEINVNKYSDVEGGVSSASVQYSYKTPDFPEEPFNLQATTINRDGLTGAVLTYINLSWELRPRPFTSSFEVEWQEQSAGVWELFPTTDMGATLGPLLDNHSYNFRVTAISPLGTRATSPVLNIPLVAGKILAPAAPTATAVGGMFSVNLAWTFGDTAKDVLGTEIWWSATNDRAGATRLTFEPYPAQGYVHPGLSAGQGGYYWLRVTNTSSRSSPWYPVGATEGLYAAASADASALLLQLQNQIGLSELAAELATPITATLPAGINTNALVYLENALMDYDMSNRIQFQEDVTNATVYVDPITGQISMLATASVTTDIEARLSTAEATLSADNAAIDLAVASVAQVGSDLTTAQSQISALQSTISVGASQVYVDNAISGATGALTVTAANSALALANTAIQEALDAFTQGRALDVMTANVATAQERIDAQATALASEVTSRSALVATTAQNGAAILDEANTRTTAVSALASRATALEATVNSPTTGLATKASVGYVDTARSDAISAAANTTALVQAQLDTGGSTQVAIASAQGTANAAVDSASAAASTANTLVARLDSGDYATVKEESSASASTLAGVVAKWSVKAQTMVDGKPAVSGIELLNGTGGSAFAVLADKFLWYMPDGSGAPKQVLTAGLVNNIPTWGFAGNQIIDGSVLARSINGTGLTITNGLYGTTPALPGGGVMTGYGVVFQGNGYFGMGAPGNSIVYDGGYITINGELVTHGNIVGKSATEFIATNVWLTDGVWTSYDFTMEHSGSIVALSRFGFTTSNINGTYGIYSQIDGTDAPDYYTGGSDGTSSLQSFGNQIPAGAHKLWLKAVSQYATGQHLNRLCILRSYR